MGGYGIDIYIWGYGYFGQIKLSIIAKTNKINLSPGGGIKLYNFHMGCENA